MLKKNCPNLRHPDFYLSAYNQVGHGVVPMMKDFSEVNLLVTKKGLFSESHSPSRTVSVTERQRILPHGMAEQSFRFSLVCLSNSLLNAGSVENVTGRRGVI